MKVTGVHAVDAVAVVAPGLNRHSGTASAAVTVMATSRRVARCSLRVLNVCAKLLIPRTSS